MSVVIATGAGVVDGKQFPLAISPERFLAMKSRFCANCGDLEVAREQLPELSGGWRRRFIEYQADYNNQGREVALAGVSLDLARCLRSWQTLIYQSMDRWPLGRDTSDPRLLMGSGVVDCGALLVTVWGQWRQPSTSDAVDKAVLTGILTALDGKLIPEVELVPSMWEDFACLRCPAIAGGESSKNS